MAGNPRGALTPLALAVLELLHEGPQHPYEMQQLMRERYTGRVVKITVGSLYHSVEKLEQAELIEVVETSREGKRPERTTYSITEAGRDAFADRLREMTAAPAKEYPQFALASAFLHTLAKADAVNQLRRRALRLEAELAADDVVVERVEEMGLHQLLWLDTAYLKAMRHAELLWVTDLLDQLDTGRLQWFDGSQPHPQPKLAMVRTEEDTG